jgi:hypothetical protein
VSTSIAAIDQAVAPLGCAPMSNRAAPSACSSPSASPCSDKLM